MAFGGLDPKALTSAPLIVHRVKSLRLTMTGTPLQVPGLRQRYSGELSHRQWVFDKLKVFSSFGAVRGES